MNTKQRGDAGEDFACAYLTNIGYHVLKRNLRCRGGEVDIVVYRDNALTFVEVKHWLTFSIEDLERSVNRKKQARIILCARQFLASIPDWSRLKVHFDVIFVGPQKITHLVDAFTESGFS